MRSYVVLYIWLKLTVEALLDRDVIDTSQGRVRGNSISLRTGKNIIQFLGIPYANANRFERPYSPAPWNATLNATKFGKSCPQPANIPPYHLKPENLSENCLNLNIFAPNTTAYRNNVASYPVLVWVHGGAFFLGSSSTLDASTMASEGELVIVTVNYRLGALGFFSIGEYGLDGNYALLDVIEALRWVQNNIKGFGGNPKKVTLGGWSAGARLVGVLMMSPLASGLYDKVIMMSGHAGGLYSYLEQKEAKHRAWYFGGLLRCPYPSSDFKNCMKRRSTQDLIQAQARMNPSSLLAPWAPVVDGKILPDIPLKLLEQGKFNGTSILTGVANDDGSLFLKTIPGMNYGVEVSNGLTREEFQQAIGNKTWIRNEDKKITAIIDFMYTDWLKPDDVNVTRRLYLDLLTDAIYRAPAIQSANAFAKKGSPVYFYQFEYRVNHDASGKLIPLWMKVPHRGDLRYLFPKPDMASVAGMTKTMLEYWINFVKSGNPNTPQQPNGWPKYDVKNQKYQAIQNFPKSESHLRVDKMVFWNEFIPKNGKAVKQFSPPTVPPRKESDSTTAALIVISCLFAILVIVFVIIIIVITFRAKRTQSHSNVTKAYEPPSKQPVHPKDQTKFQFRSSPPDDNQPSMYNNSFKSIDKRDPYPPYPHDRHYGDKQDPHPPYPHDRHYGDKQDPHPPYPHDRYYGDKQDPYPPYPHDRYHGEKNIAFVDQRDASKDSYMESDML